MRKGGQRECSGRSQEAKNYLVWGVWGGTEDLGHPPYPPCSVEVAGAGLEEQVQIEDAELWGKGSVGGGAAGAKAGVGKVPGVAGQAGRPVGRVCRAE